MKQLIVGVILVMFTLGATAQQYDEHDGKELLVKCHSNEMMDQLLEERPELADKIAEFEARKRDFKAQGGAKDDDIYIIPVVFHVIHNYGDENISPEQVQDCIRVMNEDFAAENPGVSSVHQQFQDLVANVGIRFALAKRDPDGNCTNGIVRTVSHLTSSGGENLKFISPAWDRAMYMNIWVCKTIESGAAGYTRYPLWVDDTPDIDGIVVRSDYVGAIGTSSPNRSHTMTHEVGHWLSLPHLWGSTNEPGLDSNCGIDDGISDTPETIGWTTCNTSGESCGSLDNVQNYMEYSYCSKMFTLEQAGEMRDALTTDGLAERNSLWQEENLIATGVNEAPEICAAEIAVDRRTICVGDSVFFEDYSYNGVQSRAWTFTGGLPTTSENEGVYVTYDTPGLYDVSLVASDGFAEASLTETAYIRVLDTAYTVLPFTEGFEDFTDFEDDNSIWYTENRTSPAIDWEVTDAAAYSGQHSAWVHGHDNEDGAKEYLLSQTFDLSGIEENASLTFKYSCAQKTWSSEDQLKVWISKNCGENWSLRKILDEEDLYTVPNWIPGEFVPAGQDEWNEITIDNIVSVFLNTSFRVRFEFISNNGNNVYIDDINLIDGSTVTATDELDVFKSGLSIFPNPSNDFVTISMDGSEDNEALEIRLLDVSGRLVQSVYRGMAIRTNQRIDVANLPAGLYFVEFNVQGKRFAEKIVVRD